MEAGPGGGVRGQQGQRRQQEDVRGSQAARVAVKSSLSVYFVPLNIVTFVMSLNNMSPYSLSFVDDDD